eukprot:TRINITY_DN19010_c1_g1_i2.p1 TRINITY_DN19010_c1_g1~~TRINITY_DN19010_c1_g1_i2.p1  ORF type:complete len:508 (-),score=179.79 TRINITY_DN19010_c1_g1_i2:549-2072(-)
MKIFGACLMCAWSAVAVSPMEKVFTLLEEVKAKAIADGKAEDATYQNYTDFCVKSKRDLGFDIQDGEKAVEEFSAVIDKASAEVGIAATRSEELLSTVSKNEADLEAALEIRKKEKAGHQAAQKQLMDASDMLSSAIKTLNQKLPSSSLLQQEVGEKADNLLAALGAVVDAASFPNNEKQSLMALVESATNQAPSVSAYTSKGGSIITTLEEMKTKAREDLNKIQADEMAAQHSFDLLQQSLNAQIKADQKELEEVKMSKSEVEEEKAGAEGNLAISQKDLDNDKATLTQTEASCTQAETDYKASKKVLNDELDALAKAMSVLKEKTGAATAGVYKAAMLLQVNAHSQARSHIATPGDLHSFEVVQIVRNLAKKSKSSGLDSLAQNIESLIQTQSESGQPEADVFAKVKELISNMIKQRQDLAAAETTKKAYCEEETQKTKDKLDMLSDSKDKLNAKMDKKAAEAETLKTEAATLKQADRDGCDTRSGKCNICNAEGRPRVRARRRS